MSSDIAKKCVAELIGTFWLTLGGCGTAVMAASFPQVGVGLLGVSFAFGLTVLTMAYAIGHISGCHLNPAVTIGLTAGRRFPSNLIVPYIVAQVAGAILAAAILYARLRRGQRLRRQWLRRALARSLQPPLRPRNRGRADNDVPVRHHGRDAWEGTGRLRADCDWTLPDADPPRQHPGDEHLG